MKKLMIALVGVALLAIGGSARASDESGLALGVRAGMSLPLGSAGDHAELDHLSTGALPLQLEVGWRLNRRWMAGVYGSWGPTLVASDARGALKASGATSVDGASVTRVGVQGQYTAFTSGRFEQWVGLGLGYEWARYADARFASASGTSDAQLGLRGLELSLQVGGDYRVSPRFAVGPFASASFGQYRSYYSNVDGAVDAGTPTSGSIGSKGIHEWMQLGIRGTFRL